MHKHMNITHRNQLEILRISYWNMSGKLQEYDPDRVTEYYAFII